MDVRAILLVDTQAGGYANGQPIGSLDVLGRPLAYHLAEHLRSAGVEEICALATCERPSGFYRAADQGKAVHWVRSNEQDLWRSCEQLFAEYAQSGAELLVVWSLGAYAELNLEAAVQFHLDQQARITRVHDAQGPLGVFLISASRRNDAAFLFRRQLDDFRTPPAEFYFNGYVNRLRGPHDLRQLTLDAFNQKIAIKPAGKQIRPGVWVADGARIERGARILAPAFIGARSKIRAAAVVTRATSIERHAEVDCGTVVEASNVLPFTYLGAGLDVAHAIVGHKRLAHLRRNIEVEIADPKLVDMLSQSPSVRVVKNVASLARLVPSEFIRGLFARPRRQPEVPEAVQAPAAAVDSSAVAECKRGRKLEEIPSQAPNFSSNLAVMRRYGND
jgi:carbonic anhydrase/acetyltransferase-like protein (isoleucine patch superfamily)